MIFCIITAISTAQDPFVQEVIYLCMKSLKTRPPID